MPFLPGDWPAMRTAVHAFVAAALPDYTVVWALQDAPAPAFPYASLRIIAAAQAVGHAERLYTTADADPGTPLVQAIEYDADLTLEVQLHARVANADGRSAAEVRETGMDAVALHLATEDLDLLPALAAEGWVVRGTFPPRDLTGLGGQRHESRTAVDLRLGARVRSEREVDWFADLAIVATITAGDSVTGTIGA